MQETKNVNYYRNLLKSTQLYLTQWKFVTKCVIFMDFGCDCRSVLKHDF